MRLFDALSTRTLALTIFLAVAGMLYGNAVHAFTLILPSSFAFGACLAALLFRAKRGSR